MSPARQRPDYIVVSPADFAALPGLDDWRYITSSIAATFHAASFSDAASLVQDIAAAADAADHHPDVDLRYPGVVRVRLTTHDVRSVTVHDVGLASVISSLAAAAGAHASPTTAQAVEVAIDAVDASRILPFWKAVLDYVERNGRLEDPRGAGPSFWFQEMDPPRTDRSRTHIDVYVSDDEAPERLTAALAAGGRLITDAFAPSWWVLADAEGNEACICTWQGEFE
ncbi:MAG: hypothetical protein RJB61_2164 [Actinomycetota bacterium]